MPIGMDSKIIRKLEEWQERADAPPEMIEFFQGLLSIQSRVEPPVGMAKVLRSNELIGARLEQGLPLIGVDELELDWALVRDIFIEVASVFARYPRLFGSLPQSLVSVEPHHLKEAVKAWYAGASLPTAIVAEGINESLLEDIIQATLKPFLRGCAQALHNHINQERWRRGYCPICGGNPDFAFLDKEYGARWLLCCRCDTEWLFQRLECPYCGNQEQTTLAYFTGDDGRYRLYVCEQCKQYLKAIDLRQAKEEVIMPLERLFTLGLDAQARQYGYGQKSVDKVDRQSNITERI